MAHFFEQVDEKPTLEWQGRERVTQGEQRGTAKNYGRTGAKIIVEAGGGSAEC